MLKETSKNMAPAPVQVTAESILQEAFRSQATPLDEDQLNSKIADLEESKEYQARKRTEFEKALRKDYKNTRAWLNYANFEYSQHEMTRVRSIFERALDHNKENVQLWIRYADLEIKNYSINHARNLLERATRILPYADKVWFYYVQLEESLSNIEGARSIFHRWLIYEPHTNVYDAYINFEKRYNNYSQARDAFAGYVVVHPQSTTWIKWINFEEKYGDSKTIREIFTLAVDTLFQIDKKKGIEDILIRWINFEATEKELERGRALFKFGLNKLPKPLSRKLFENYLIFEKKHGDPSGMNLVLLSKRKEAYEQDLERNPQDYDLWWNYLTLMTESLGNNKLGLANHFEKAIKNQPQDNSSKSVQWRKYITLWMRYLFFLELELKDTDKTRDAYKQVISVIPHKSFTFSKIWINYAKFEIRQHNLVQARKVLGQSLGMCGKPKTFKYYINLEMSLKEMDRVRKLYENFLIQFPMRVVTWLEYAKLETNLGDYERATGIYELAIEEPYINNNLIVWYKYINFLAEELHDYEKARSVFARVLSINKKNVKIWIKWALFEVAAPSEEQLHQIRQQEENENDNEEEEEIEVTVTEESIGKARKVFEDGLVFFKNENLVDERVLFFEAYKQFEEIYGTPETTEKITRRLPTIIKKTNTAVGGDEEEEEEEVEYKFPDDEEKNAKMLKFLQNARKWKSSKKD